MIDFYNEKNRQFLKIIIFFYFSIYLLVGFMLVEDYGLSSDDTVQRNHSLINYKYINKVLFNRNVVELKDFTDLEEYDLYYGIALQLPMVLFEDIHDFSLTTHEIYYMRHIFIFIYCFVGLIFFYLALKKIFSDSILVPFLGLLFLSLYPRFFGNQFCDIKNRLFAAICMVTFYFMILAVENKKPIFLVLFGCVTALAVNTRMMALIFLAVLLGYYFISDIIELFQNYKESFNVKNVIKKSEKYLIIILSFAFFWILFTPKAWCVGGGKAFVATFNQFSNFSRWNGTMVFMGDLITCEQMPWYYLFVWFGISIPIFYILLFVIGHVVVFKSLKSHFSLNTMLTTYKWFFCSLFLFYGSVFAVIFLHSRIYVGWHHMYYVFVPFCVLVCYGLKWIININPKIIFFVLILYFFFQVAWIYNNHPWETAYFNLFSRPVAANYDRGELNPSTLVLVKWILNNEKSSFSLPDNYYKRIYMLEENEKKRIIFSDEPQYIICNYRNIIGNDYIIKGYNEIYTVEVDGYKVGSVFKKK